MTRRVIPSLWTLHQSDGLRYSAPSLWRQILSFQVSKLLQGIQLLVDTFPVLPAYRLWAAQHYTSQHLAIRRSWSPLHPVFISILAGGLIYALASITLIILVVSGSNGAQIIIGMVCSSPWHVSILSAHIHAPTALSNHSDNMLHHSSANLDVKA